MAAKFQKFTTHLCYDNQAEEAVALYTSLFENSGIKHVLHYGKDQHGPEGSVLGILFELCGVDFWAVNGGPYFKFEQGMSIYVKCEMQEEIDKLWEKLAEGGKQQMCGWLVDKFGVSWQIAPAIVEDMMRDPHPEKAQRMLNAVLEMEKYDIEELKRVYEGGSTIAA
jgi:predicted 3-demethylubiquinone-9 3-methyltransferase (glyoxalase superfamily)